jgi:hypothetical protein
MSGAAMVWRLFHLSWRVYILASLFLCHHACASVQLGTTQAQLGRSEGHLRILVRDQDGNAVRGAAVDLSLFDAARDAWASPYRQSGVTGRDGVLTVRWLSPGVRRVVLAAVPGGYSLPRDRQVREVTVVERKTSEVELQAVRTAALDQPR